MDRSHRLRTDWLVVVARDDPAASGAAAAAAARAGTGVGLSGRSGDDHLVWTAGGGRVVVAAWRAPGDPPAPWHVGPSSVTIVRGQLRRRGQPWSDPRRWSGDLAAAPDGSGHPLGDHVGDGSLVRVAADGRGVVATDPVGAAVAYTASGGGVDVVASRPALAAWAVTPEGRHPDRDPWAAACLAHAGHLLRGTTGHLGVARVLAGEVVAVDPHRGAVTTDGRPWLEVGDLAGRSLDDLCDVVEEEVADQIVAAAGVAEDLPVLDLTGGKDSRLVLAVALRRLGPGAFRTRTVGAPDSPDVRVAREIADRLGLAHESGIPLRAERPPLDQEVDAFLAATDGTANVWSALGPPVGSPVVRLSGTVAEALRADVREAAWWGSRHLAGPPGVDELAAATADRFRAVSGRFLLPEVEDRLDAEVHAAFASVAASGVVTDELLRAFYLRHHAVRFCGRYLELDHDHRVLAALSLSALQAVSALDPELRRREAVHRTLVERASPVLASLPFAGPGWPPAARPASTARPPSPPPVPAPLRRRARRAVGRAGRAVLRRPVAAGRPPGPDAHASSLPKQSYATVAVARARPDQARRALVEESLADRTSPVWDLVDAERVRAAIAGFDDLPMGPRQRLYGLAGAARWLAG